jgi:hypothetical protein
VRFVPVETEKIVATTIPTATSIPTPRKIEKLAYRMFTERVDIPEDQKIMVTSAKRVNR